MTTVKAHTLHSVGTSHRRALHLGQLYPLVFSLPWHAHTAGYVVCTSAGKPICMRSADDEGGPALLPEAVEDEPRTCAVLVPANVGGGETNSNRRSRKARSSRATR